MTTDTVLPYWVLPVIAKQEWHMYVALLVKIDKLNLSYVIEKRNNLRSDLEQIQSLINTSIYDLFFKQDRDRG